MNAVNNKSTTVALFPILEALRQLNVEGMADKFSGISDQQNELLALLPLVERAERLPESMVKTLIVKHDVEKLNNFLKQNGFDIALQGPIDLGIATIMNLLGTWKGDGNEVSITHETATYPAIHLDGGAILHTIGDKQYVHIQTNEQLNVYLELDTPATSGMELFKTVLNNSTLKFSTTEKCTVVFPMVSLDEQPDISWIKGMEILEPEYLFVSEVVQQNKLSMNPKGIHAQSAFAMGLSRGISMTRQVRVDKPFTLWITYGNEPLPLFGAYLAPDSWKNPDK